MTLLSDIRDYPWRSLLIGLLPTRLAGLLPARFQTKTAQIVPSASVAGNALTVVIAIMSFLACLTAGAVYMINQSAQAWVNDIASEITIELDPVNAADIDKKVTVGLAINDEPAQAAMGQRHTRCHADLRARAQRLARPAIGPAEIP